jgi:hypothetical protein
MADANTREWKLQEQVSRGILSQLRKGCPVIIADNVAAYMYGNNVDQAVEVGGIKCDPDRFGCLFSPFPVFFIEWRQPIALRERLPGAVSTTGYLVGEGEAEDDVLQHRPTAARQLLFWHCYERLTGQPAISGNIIQVIVDNKGGYLGERDHCGPDFPRKVATSSAGIALQTIGFMNCRNVERLDAPEEAPTPKWCRRQRVPELRYQVLRIDPNRLVPKKSDEHKTEGDRSGKALHICRGHFAHYVEGESAGLFGKGLYGSFWIPSHARGSLEHGRVISQYEVEPVAIKGETNGASLQ